MQSVVIIEANSLVKDYDKFRAVDNVSFKVYERECFGFLGPNGAGKTTIMRMMHCVLPITSGELLVAGMNVKEKARDIKGLIGVVPQENNLDPDFTVLQNLLVFSRYFDIQKDVAKKRATELLEFFNLTEKMNVVIDHLSTGMKRRLVIARALINEPKILILDEPTTGLDPQARHLIWDRIKELQKIGVTIIITTHYMDEAAQLCGRIIIMDHGKIIEEGDPKSIVRKYAAKSVLEVTYTEELLSYLKSTSPETREEVIGDRIHIYTEEPERVLSAIMKVFTPKETLIRDANLEDVFLKLTGRRLRE